MRTRLIIIALAIIPALYLLARPSAEPRNAARAPAPSAPLEAKQQLREEIALQAQARDRLDARLSELEGRLNAMELQAPEPIEVDHAPATATPRNDLSERDIATWMDDQLRAGTDAAASQQASSQLTAAFAAAKRMDLHVESVACGARFCRASFYRDDGALPAAADVYGAPPITGEGFTIEEPDGRLAVYFARNGERVGDFREEALVASAP